MLRELALREVASSMDRQRAEIAQLRRAHAEPPSERLLVAMSSNPPRNAILLRKASRIAGRLNTDWVCLYVQTPEERADRIDSDVQRKLVDNIQLAQSLGAEIAKVEATDVADAILRYARSERVSMIVVGQTQRSWWYRVQHGSVLQRLLERAGDLDVLIVSFNEDG
jgi:two-component system sensor histidine kinase KdpD